MSWLRIAADLLRDAMSSSSEPPEPVQEAPFSADISGVIGILNRQIGPSNRGRWLTLMGTRYFSFSTAFMLLLEGRQRLRRYSTRMQLYATPLRFPRALRLKTGSIWASARNAKKG